MRRLTAILAFLASCAAPGRLAAPLAPSFGPTAADALRAEQVVWAGIMHLGPLRPPAVEWTRDDIPCPGEGPGEMCLGLFYSGTWRAQVMWAGSFHASAWSHELLHAMLFLNTGNADGKHERPEWATVPDMDAALQRAGL